MTTLPRRSFLAGTLLLPAAACTAHAHHRLGTPAPAVDARTAAVARENALLAAYARAAALRPELAARLAPLQADHVAHLTALGAAPPTAPAPPPHPAPGAASLAGLAELEQETADAHAAAALAASGELAALLAELAACEASHRVLLR